MNDLILASENYELIDWNGKEENLKVYANHVPFDKESFSILKSTDSLFKQQEIINVVDVEFKSSNIKANKSDIAFATLSGIISSALDYLFVGKINIENIKLKDIKLEDIYNSIPKIMKLMDLNESNIRQAEKAFNAECHSFNEYVNKSDNYKKMAKDFASNLSVKSLAFSIIENIIGYHIGVNKNGSLEIREFRDDEKINGTVSKKIIGGILAWFTEQASEYKKNGKFKEEKNDIINLTKHFSVLKDIIIELSNTQLYKENGFSSTKLKKELVKLINKSKEDDMQDVLELLAVQSIPVVFNRCMVKSYLLIKILIQQIKEKRIDSIEGLKYLNFNLDKKEHKRALSIMNTISTGVFAALDIGSAASIAFLKHKHDSKVKFINEFVSRVNVANLIELVTVTKADLNYIFENTNDDSKTLKTSQIKKEKYSFDDFSKYITLNKLETKILYSLEYNYIKKDIELTKKSSDQIAKDKWLDKWTSLSEKASNINKLYEKDDEKLFSIIKTYISNQSENNWTRIILELMLFKPYFNLNKSNSTKNIKCKIAPTLSLDRYIGDILAVDQAVFNLQEYALLKKNYKKHYSELGILKLNPAVGVAAAVAVTALTGGVAFVFAPAIATTLVGGSLAGLYGVALTNASLALIGGGSLAVGGLGVAGGTAIIAGGGALIGLGTSGATMSAFILMTSSEFARIDYAKLLTNCDFILINKYHRIDEVTLIGKNLEGTLEDYRTRYALLKSKANSDKKFKEVNKNVLEELSKSIDITNKCLNSLNKILSNASK